MMTLAELHEQFGEKIWVLRREQDTEWDIARQYAIADMDLVWCTGGDSEAFRADQLYQIALDVCGPEIVEACLFYGWIQSAEPKYMPTETEWEAKRAQWEKDGW